MTNQTVSLGKYCFQPPKGGAIRDTKTLNLSRNTVSLQVFFDVSRFSAGAINLTCNKNVCCGLKKCGALIGWFSKSRANLFRDKFWVWWKKSNKAKICCSNYTRALLFSTTFFNPQQMSLLRVKLIAQDEKRKTSTRTCNEAMLRDKLRGFFISCFAALSRSRQKEAWHLDILFY